MGAKRHDRTGATRKAIRPAHTGHTGTPDEATIQDALADLGPAGQDAARRILALVAEHLGSPEAAQLWLVTHSPEFGMTPLAAIAAGKADLVLALLESRWGPNPAYA